MDNFSEDMNTFAGESENAPQEYIPQSQSNTGGYQTGYYPQQGYQYGNAAYGGYASQPVMNLFTVAPDEKRRIKGHYAGTFIMALIHHFGSTIIALAGYAMIQLIFGYEARYTDDGILIVDWVYDLAASLPSIIVCLAIFFVEKSMSGNKLSGYFSTEKITGLNTIGFLSAAALAYGVTIVLQGIILSGFMSIDISPLSEEYLNEPDLCPSYLAATFITSVVLAPIAEELMFRGVILRRLSAVSGRFAIIVSAVCFGLMHGNLLQAILGFVLGLIFGYAAVKTGSLVLPIIGHMFMNFMAVSNEFVEYFGGEELASSVWTLTLISCFIVGIIGVIAMAASKKVVLPEYTEYHKRRTFPIMITCISFWILMAAYIVEVISAFGPVTEKMLES